MESMDIEFACSKPSDLSFWRRKQQLPSRSWCPIMSAPFQAVFSNLGRRRTWPLRTNLPNPTSFVRNTICESFRKERQLTSVAILGKCEGLACREANLIFV
ncbi:hypothetical protein BDZ45DRAFT_196547 [Acephala macrosclerotiorum]|nr:hypothetical protein BDZ45DRAFT_196547 [Acephala macrosclerotiorum]